MRIGAQVSTAGGLDKAIERAQEIGAEAVQLFCWPPRRWTGKPVSDQVAASFRDLSDATGIAPAFLHGTYLMNFGSQDPALLERSVEALIATMECAARIGALGVIFHSGSHLGAGYDAVLDQEVAALSAVLERSPAHPGEGPNGPWLVIENAAGMGNQIGASFAEIGRIMKGIADPRVKLCLDTAHTLAAGYDIAHADGLERMVEELDREVGLASLVAVHANDSKIPLSGGVDRHENIGDGHIGLAGFETVLAHPAFQDVPFLLEVPGIDGNGPDLENIERLKAVRDRVGAG